MQTGLNMKKKLPLFIGLLMVVEYICGSCLYVIMHGLCSAVERSEREGLGGDLLVNTLASQQRSPSPGDSSLESEMAKAVQESKMLKAVVVPLEAVCKGGGQVCNVVGVSAFRR